MYQIFKFDTVNNHKNACIKITIMCIFFNLFVNICTYKYFLIVHKNCCVYILLRTYWKSLLLISNDIVIPFRNGFPNYVSPPIYLRIICTTSVVYEINKKRQVTSHYLDSYIPHSIWKKKLLYQTQVILSLIKKENLIYHLCDITQPK